MWFGLVQTYVISDLFLFLFTAITCDSCGGNCTGEVLKVQDKHFHIECFTCKGKKPTKYRTSSVWSEIDQFVSG